MIKRLIYSIVVISLLSANGVASAEEEKGGTQIKASLKSWVNDWKREVLGAGSVTSNAIVLAGPAVEVEFRNGPVIEASYLASLSDYKFTEAGVTFDFDRRDLDLAIGKWINPYVGFFFGYRNSSFKEKRTGAKDFSYGMTYSARGSVPLTENASLYGNLTWLNIRFKAEGQAREDAPGWIVEVGGKNEFTKQFAMKLGYKWETTKGEVSQVKDSFKGATIELVYSF